MEIVLGIYLSLTVTNCSGECSVSTLKCIKKRVTNMIGQDRLSDPTLMNIELIWLGLSLNFPSLY